MERKTAAIWFSPTGGARAYVRAVAAALPGPVEELDLTRPAVRRETHAFTAGDVVVIGVPVYYGRVPAVPALLDSLRGEDTPAVLLAVYGNRAIDDALAELADLAAARGFKVLAAGSFVAPHTFSARVGAGRPSGADLAAAAELGQKAADKLAGPWAPPALPGSRPYKEFKTAPFYPVGDGKCVSCGACARACPVEAIDPAAPRETDPARCIRCLACMKACPTGSRHVDHPGLAATTAWLEENFLCPERPAELFL